MSVLSPSPPPPLVCRPAIDTRPPAELWLAPAVLPHPVPSEQPPLHLVDEAEGEHEDLGDPPTASRVPVSVDLSPSGIVLDQRAELIDQVRTWGPWFAQLLTEALDGRRPLEALGRWLDEWVLAEVSRQVRLRRRIQGRATTGVGPPTTVVSLRCQLTHPRVLEVSVLQRRGGESFARAFQLRRAGDRWRCTALQLAPTATR